MSGARIVPLLPNGTNSTFFTECCRVAICADEPNCPACGEPVVGHDEPNAERRHHVRWGSATRNWKRKNGRVFV